MTFKELSAWISAALIVAVYSFYLVHAPEAVTKADALALFLKITIFTVVAEIILQSVAGSLHRPEKTDERDTLILAKAKRNSASVLATGIVLTNIALLMPAEALGKFVPMPQITLAVHMLVLTIAASELLRLASQIVYYRKGA